MRTKQLVDVVRARRPICVGDLVCVSAEDPGERSKIELQQHPVH